MSLFPPVKPRVVSHGDFVEIVQEGAYAMDYYRTKKLVARHSIISIEDRRGWDGKMVTVVLNDFGKRVQLDIWDNYDRVLTELDRTEPTNG